MNKDTGEEVTAAPSPSTKTSSRSRSRSKQPNCARCGKPLGATKKKTADGEVCYSCYNEPDPERKGIVTDWRFEPEIDADTGLPNVIATLDNGNEVAITIKSEEEAEKHGPRMVGMVCWDHGEEWLFKPTDGGEI